MDPRARAAAPPLAEAIQYCQSVPMNATDASATAVIEAAGRVVAEGVAIAGPTAAVSVVPYQSRPAASLPEKRRETLAAQLYDRAERAFSGALPAAPAPDDAPQPAAVALACAVCQGACCASGGDCCGHLSPDDLARQREGDPTLTPQALAARYLDHLPAETVIGGCPFHGARGCSLPRTMRSELCNRFLCRGQRLLAEAVAAGAKTSVILAECRGRAAAAGAVDAKGRLHRLAP